MTNTPAAQAGNGETDSCEHEWVGIADDNGIVTHLRCEQCCAVSNAAR